MPYANINGANLYYEEYGSGPPLILTPGGRVDREGLRPFGRPDVSALPRNTA